MLSRLVHLSPGRGRTRIVCASPWENRADRSLPVIYLQNTHADSNHPMSGTEAAPTTGHGRIALFEGTLVRPSTRTQTSGTGSFRVGSLPKRSFTSSIISLPVS
ncbi:MAG: hypothetical protein ACLQO6_01235 [Desulfomonilaceae bacterium]